MTSAVLKYLIISTLLLSSYQSYAQWNTLEFKVINALDSSAIAGVHIFVANSSFGTNTDANGNAKLSIPQGSFEDIIITHLSYDSKIINPNTYNKAKTNLLKLTPSQINIGDIVITEKRSAAWKKQFKKFKKAFIGVDQSALQTSIENPEVLRFNESDGIFTTTAVDLIQIKNEFLKYEIDFLLDKLTIESNGSSQYRGWAKFTDLSESDNRKIEKNRTKTFEQSPRHFYLSLIQNQLKKNGYKLNHLSYDGSNFNLIKQANRDSILHYDTLNNQFLLRFPDFLQIVNTKIKTDQTSEGVQIANSSRTDYRNNAADENYSSADYAQSKIYKVAPFLVLDANGNIKNPQAMKEYGFWAEQRISRLLPWDYGQNFTLANHTSKQEEDYLQYFNAIIYEDLDKRSKAITVLEQKWSEAFIAPLLEIIRLTDDQQTVKMINELLFKKVGKASIPNYYKGLEYLWSKEESYDDYYLDFKAEIYKHVDPKFYQYFYNRQSESKIRIDEIVWGGVVQDGIPPLRFPKMVSSHEADYLDDNDVVFGVSLNGVTRAYPKRILAWHEFFVDDFNGQQIAGVYCTLCGTVILYDMTHKGILNDLGTSGFLYRSNKLMYDKATQSLWNTIEGKPVLGPLVTEDIKLEAYHVVTTDWRDWKKTHPDTKVLSIETGHKRNYDEGNAYKDYFATDQLMFPVPIIDERLKNKDEVFVIRNFEATPKAFAVDFLKKHTIHHDSFMNVDVVIITNPHGAIRAYETKGQVFKALENNKLIDNKNNAWEINEAQLRDSKGEKLKRLAGHQIFWFAWKNAYPNTKLIK